MRIILTNLKKFIKYQKNSFLFEANLNQKNKIKKGNHIFVGKEKAARRIHFNKIAPFCATAV
jgi:hypothetical protein